jgi:hypothetical protein
MPVKTSPAQQTRWLREQYREAREKSAEWKAREVEMREALVAHLCPVKPGDKIRITDAAQAHKMGQRVRDVLVVKRVRFYRVDEDATARNPLFVLTFGHYREMVATLGVLRMRRWFKVVKPTKRKPT